MVGIFKVDAQHVLWSELVAHLERCDHLRHVSNEQSIATDLLFLTAAKEGRVVGHISLREQALLVPAQPPIPMVLAGVELREAFVQTFFVEEQFRRQGWGTALQLAALAASRELGCHQLRSWSSLDKPENYALKLKLGFAFCPGVHLVKATGEEIPGGWFVRPV